MYFAEWICDDLTTRPLQSDTEIKLDTCMAKVFVCCYLSTSLQEWDTIKITQCLLCNTKAWVYDKISSRVYDRTQKLFRGRNVSVAGSITSPVANRNGLSALCCFWSGAAKCSDQWVRVGGHAQFRTAPVVANWWHSSCKKLTDTFLAGRDRGVQQALRGRRSPHRRKRWCLQQCLGLWHQRLLLWGSWWSSLSNDQRHHPRQPVPSCNTNGWDWIVGNR